MTCAEQELARRCVACRTWVWHPGMAKTDPVTGTRWRMLSGGVWIYDGGQLVSASASDIAHSRARAFVAGPDLSDAATVGALLVVGEMSVGRALGKWRVSCSSVGTQHTFTDTLGEAVAASWLRMQEGR